MRYRYFDHEAGIGLEADGKTLEEAFENAALAMFAVMVEPALVLPDQQIEIAFEEVEVGRALLTWLDRLLAQARLHGLVFCAFELRRVGNAWRGAAWGMPCRPGEGRGTEVKAVIRTGLKVEATPKGWRARCVVEA